MEIKIEQDVPIPKPKVQFKAHLDQLEIGQSFRVPLEHWASLRNAVGNQNRRSERTYTVHKVKERGDDRKLYEFARVWRTE